MSASSRPVAQALGSAAKGIDEGPVADAELNRCRIVRRVDEGRGAAAGETSGTSPAQASIALLGLY